MKHAFDLYRSFLERGTEGLSYDTISKSMRIKWRYGVERAHSGYANDEHFSWFGENKEFLLCTAQSNSDGRTGFTSGPPASKWCEPMMESGDTISSLLCFEKASNSSAESEEMALGTSIPVPRCTSNMETKETNPGTGVPDGQTSREDSEVQEPSAAVQQVHPGRAIVLAGVDRRRKEVCQTCFASFKRAHDLRRHEFSTHTDERPFKCDVCNQKFSRADNLRQHEKIHKKNRSARS